MYYSFIFHVTVFDEVRFAGECLYLHESNTNRLSSQDLELRNYAKDMYSLEVIERKSSYGNFFFLLFSS